MRVTSTRAHYPRRAAGRNSFLPRRGAFENIPGIANFRAARAKDLPTMLPLAAGTHAGQHGTSCVAWAQASALIAEDFLRP